MKHHSTDLALVVACVLLLGALVTETVAHCKTERSAAVWRAFRKTHPCPSTGQMTGACKGWVVDHIWPLCFDGLDEPDNMQWQTADDAKKKDRFEDAACALKRRCAKEGGK